MFCVLTFTIDIKRRMLIHGFKKNSHIIITLQAMCCVLSPFGTIYNVIICINKCFSPSVMIHLIAFCPLSLSFMFFFLCCTWCRMGWPVLLDGIRGKGDDTQVEIKSILAVNIFKLYIHLIIKMYTVNIYTKKNELFYKMTAERYLTTLFLWTYEKRELSENWYTAYNWWMYIPTQKYDYASILQYCEET
jgi:hypothetical protein